MASLNERIRSYRNQMHLSQEYVANYLGMSRVSFTQLESGKRNVSAEDLSKLGVLFGVTSDTLLYGQQVTQPSALFARSFEELDQNDQEEIMNLIRFKQMMKAQRAK